MKRIAYFLILLLLWSLVDDGLVVAFVLPSAPLTDDIDDDEYLASPRPPREVESRPDKKPVFVGLKLQTADFSLARRGVPAEWNLTTPCTLPPLYVFMSLQI
jgi:hypothetical protein